MVRSGFDYWTRWLSAAPSALRELEDIISITKRDLMDSVINMDDRKMTARSGTPLAGSLKAHLEVMAYSSRVQRVLLDGSAEKIRSRAQSLGYHIHEAYRIVGTRNIEEVRRHLPGVLETIATAKREIQNLAGKWTVNQKALLLSNIGSTSTIDAFWIVWMQFIERLNEVFINISVLPALEDLEQKMQMVIDYGRVSKELQDSSVKAAQAAVVLRFMAGAYVDFIDDQVLHRLAGLDNGLQWTPMGTVTRLMPSPQSAPTASEIDGSQSVVTVKKQDILDELNQIADRFGQKSTAATSPASVGKARLSPSPAQQFPAGPPAVAPNAGGRARARLALTPGIESAVDQQQPDPAQLPIEGINKPQGPLAVDDATLYDDLSAMVDEELIAPPAINEDGQQVVTIEPISVVDMIKQAIDHRVDASYIVSYINMSSKDLENSLPSFSDGGKLYIFGYKPN